MQSLKILPKSCCSFEFLLFLISLQAFLASGSASLQAGFQSNELPVANDRQNRITDALYQIAQVLQDNQQHSTLYERITSLEASLSVSLEQNKLLESRIKILEDKIPDMNAKIEISSSLFEKTEALESSTNDKMEGFEEKLSTIVGEMLRWKSIVHKSKEIVEESSKNRLDDVIVEASREVEIRKICPLAPSSRLPQNEPDCLFTSEETFANWTMAERLCQLQGGSLASFYDVQSVDLPKGKSSKFWLSSAPDEKFLEDKDKLLKETYKYFGNDFTSTVVPVSNVQYLEAENSGNINSKHVNMLRASEILSQDTLERSSDVVDILSLPNFEGPSDEKSDKNVYVSNFQSDDGERYELQRISKSSSDMDIEVGSGDSETNNFAKNSLEGLDSLSKPQDAVSFKEFLFLKPAELEKNDKLSVGGPTLNGRPMTDSSSDPISVSLFSLLKGEPSSRFIRQDIKREENVSKKCPLLLCTDDSDKCLVLKRPCLELNSFWCKRKG